MDVSLVAAIGSFVMSERLLRPKALVMVGLALLLLHDLATHSNDAASLRIYRGPGFLAFGLFCGALSLRMWRRNGIACDELLFLPGTPLEDERQRHGTWREELANLFGSALETAAQVGGESSTEQPSELRARSLSSDDVRLASTQEQLMAYFLSLCGLSFLPFFQRVRNSQLVRQEEEERDAIVQANLGSAPATTLNWAYSPSGAAVTGAALDLALPVLLNFHLFISAYNHPKYAGSDTPKIFPLIFFTVLNIRAQVPCGKRRRFWGSFHYTMWSPIFTVKFRDEIIGDILTSLVRPLQDVAFAYVYYLVVLFHRHDIGEASRICNDSWLLQLWILPGVAILPLWWRFLQCLRQARDTRCRWPYYGNAFKYLTATLIVLYDIAHGMPTTIGNSASIDTTTSNDTTDEYNRRTWWSVCFLLATIYQIWWDTFVDWELFVLDTSAVSMASPDTQFKWTLANMSKLSLKLRTRRMYPSDRLYYGIFYTNCIFRFLWMLSLIPARHISADDITLFTSHSKVHFVNSYSADMQSYLGPIIACGEIVRRCLWGILRVELESIKLYGNYGVKDESSALTIIDPEDPPSPLIMRNTSMELTSLTRRSSLRATPSMDEDLPDTSSCDKNWKSISSSACMYTQMLLERTRNLELMLWVVGFIACGLHAVRS